MLTWLGLDEVEHHQARFDGVRLMLSPVAAISVANCLIEWLVLEMENLAIMARRRTTERAPVDEFACKIERSLSAIHRDRGLKLPAAKAQLLPDARILAFLHALFRGSRNIDRLGDSGGGLLDNSQRFGQGTLVAGVQLCDESVVFDRAQCSDRRRTQSAAADNLADRL